MKIALIVSEGLHVPPVKGGAIETWVYEVGKRLADAGHEVNCLSFYDPLMEKSPGGGKVNVLAYRKGIWAKVLLCSWKLPFKKIQSTLYYLPYSLWCGVQTRKVRAEIIHVQTRPNFIPILRFLNPRAKLILHLHNVSAIDCEGKKWGRSLFDKADLIVACSEYLKNEIITRYPYLSEKTQVMYNGVDTSRFNEESEGVESTDSLRTKHGIRADETVLLYMGRLVEYKGVHILIDAVRNLVAGGFPVRLFVVGGHTYSNNSESTYTAELREKASQSDGKVVFTGYVDHERVPDYLKLCDIVVVPSLWEEPFGVVVLEGMAFGKCVVAFEKGGIKEIMRNNENGLLLAEDSPAALTRVLEGAIRDPRERKRLGSNARIWVRENFTWEKIAQAVNDSYLSLEG